jgi:hypothetical protein
MSVQPARTRIEIPPLHAPITAVRVATLRQFLDEMHHDAERVRHREVRWSTETVTSTDEHRVIFDLLTAGYIAEEDHPKLIEVRLPCGRLGLSRREEDIAGQEQIAAALERIQQAVKSCDLDWRPGRLSLDPSPLMPTTADVLRRLCSTIHTPEGTSYAPWTDGWAIGVECRRRDGYRTLLYLNPSGETEEEDGSVFVYQGVSGDPAMDMPAHWYDPFTMPEPMQWFTVRTDNADRQWRATSADDAQRKHHEAFGGLRGENIRAVLHPATPEPRRTP